ncbi:Aliphatic sulfonates import ATP-binding protein SsuB [Clostridium liquoris]|jgi:NitT/TauT family transport system ATP-binding protein|uniref:Aliphatic sulfonates import ATP-binding protein SsuB n=1 Tax=Clostridium liquoris TaxID=1289519 RepID=A0A2T0B055_9CLOT|nr:ABC transporter ATP-binding protein [Clostridium liquoris]PRR76896.1 Aliphatic sulfonates import ATP-binding protein SsuB [Clostridium liquoris]
MGKVEIKEVYMNYHSLKSSTSALNNISFSVNDSEFLSIVGPSGCGKSTILNIIVGLLKPSSGEVYIDSELINGVSPKIGYMFQRDHLFEWLTVWDNIMLGLKIQHKLDIEKKDRIINLLKDYSLWDFKDHYPNELSGGMRQRVALIRTLALNPEVLLLDEPFSALDYQTRLNVSDDIYKILKKENKTVIMVTHDLSEAISMSDRILVLSNRPAKIKKELNINFELDSVSPLKRREAPEFRGYFNELWKELNS